MDMKKFWNSVRVQKEQIREDYPLVISLEDEVRQAKGGTVAEVTRDAAARLLVEKTHRLCTPAEAEEFRRAEAAKREKGLQEEAVTRLAREVAKQQIAPLFPPPAAPAAESEAKPPKK